jgi:Skp family chaperone for outer membrane proteins
VSQPPAVVFGEDVRQHRVFKRVVGATILLLTLLLAAASYAAYYANERRKETDAARGAERVQRDQAVAARGEAEQRRVEAEEQTREAVKQKGIAEEQTREAEKQRKEAEKQTGIALEQRNRAEEQTKIAVEQRNRAEEQTRIAEQRRREAEEARDEAAFQLAETLADRAEEQSAPGKDIVQALHLATRAAMVSPKGRPETSLHVARVLHMAASLPRVLDLEKSDARLLRASLDADLKHLLAMTGDYRLALWDVQTGRRAPLPAGLDAKVGRRGDPATGDGYVEWESLGFSPDGRLAKAVFKDDTAGSYTLWVWEAANGRKRDEISMEGQPDAVVFSADGKAVLRKNYYCGGGGSQDKEGNCCLRVLWQDDKSAPPPAEVTGPCEGKKGDDENHEQLLYRGRRPVLVQDRGDAGLVGARA